MPATTTLTIRVTPELKAKLARLADLTRRSSSQLAAEALEQYVAYETPIVESINRGLEDIKAGRVHAHEDVMARLEAIIQKHETKQAAA